MLALTVTPEGPSLVITHAAPMPYLDHWAFRKFSGDAGLGARLAAALRARGGTLALSWLNLGEYAAVSDPAQRRAAEQFVESVLPRIFCVDVDLAAVDKRERDGDPMPHADRALAAMFVNLGGPEDSPFTAKGIFEQLHDAGLARTQERLAATVQERLEVPARDAHDGPVLPRGGATRRASRRPGGDDADAGDRPVAGRDVLPGRPEGHQAERRD